MTSMNVTHFRQYPTHREGRPAPLHILILILILIPLNLERPFKLEIQEVFGGKISIF